jgi:DNA-binding MarR family transcriptional regulator
MKLTTSQIRWDVGLVQGALTATAAGRSLVEQVRRLREAWLAERLRELSAQERSALRAAAPVLEKLSQS